MTQKNIWTRDSSTRFREGNKDMVKTQYPEVKTYLDDELLNDPYIASYIKNGNDLYMAGRRNVMFCQELP